MNDLKRPYEALLWVELIGFDNELADYGVEAYLQGAGLVPDAVSLFVYTPEFVHTHAGTLDETLLPPDCGSYGGHPSNYQRARQDWTRAQLLRLVRALQSHGIAVFFCVFDVCASPTWIAEHPEILNITNEGERTGSISPFKHLSDGSLYEDFFTRQLGAVLRDYGFDGYHQGDGYCHPRYPLYKADYSADMTAQFCAHAGCELPETIGPEAGDEPGVVTERSAWIWRHARAEWIHFHADRMVQFCEKVISVVHAEGKKVILNNALTRDPFQALYRHGVDYQRIAAAGADGFVIETVAPGVIIGGESGRAADPHYDFQATVLLISAAVPNRKLWCINSAHDVNEQWDVLLHGPTLLEREIYCHSSLLRQESGDLRRCVSGALVCLADGIRPHEWEWLRRWWELGYGTDPRGVLGATVVWSDEAHANQLDDYLATRRYSTHKLLYELMTRGAPLHCVVDVADTGAVQGPLVVLNPHLFPREQLESVLARDQGPVIMVGGLPEWLPETTHRFSDCHGPNELGFAAYGDIPPAEVSITDDPEIIPEDLMDLPDPPFYFDELYFRKVSDSFLDACAETICGAADAVEVKAGDESINVRALDMGPGRVRLLVDNSAPHYVIAELDLHRPIKRIEVATAFPGQAPPVAESRIWNLRVPGRGMVVLDVEMDVQDGIEQRDVALMMVGPTACGT